MPPEPFNMIEMIGNISSSMQYAFSSCESVREIHFPTFESLITDNYDIDEKSKQVSDSFINMLNLAVDEVVGRTV